AAIQVKIDERERAGVAKSRAVQREQHVAVLGMGIVVPAEPVVAEGQGRGQGEGGEDGNGETVGGVVGGPGLEVERRHRGPGARRTMREISFDGCHVFTDCYEAEARSSSRSETIFLDDVMNGS